MWVRWVRKHGLTSGSQARLLARNVLELFQTLRERGVYGFAWKIDVDRR